MRSACGLKSFLVWGPPNPEALANGMSTNGRCSFMGLVLLLRNIVRPIAAQNILRCGDSGECPNGFRVLVDAVRW